MKKVLLFVNQRKRLSVRAGNQIKRWCEKYSVDYILHTYSSSPLDSDDELAAYQQQIKDLKLDMIIVVGGDGTLLRAARAFASLEIPILPIAAGNLGFLMYINSGRAILALEELAGVKELPIERRLMIKGSFLPIGRPIYALNEIVVTLDDRTRMTRFSVNIAKTLINTYRSDGLIISTATGSSAYNLSAGGPLVYPANESIILTPICSHSLSSRPIVLNPEHPIEVALSKQEQPLSIIADGQEKRLLHPGQTLVVRRSPYDLKLIRSKYATSFFEALRDKLSWR